MFRRILRHITRLCSPWPFEGTDDRSSDLSSTVYACEWTPDHIPVTRLSVTAQAGSQHTSARSWISALARAPNTGQDPGPQPSRRGTASREKKPRRRGRRKEPPKPTESMMMAPVVRGGKPRQRVSAKPSQSSPSSGISNIPLAGSEPSDLGSIPSWPSSESASRHGSDGHQRFVVRGIVGEGAFGKVYLVRDVVAKQDAAMKVVRITGGLSSAYDYRCVITEVEVLHRLGDDPQAFLLSPYMGCERRDWLSPFGDLHILTRYYAGGTLECYLGRLSHREVWLVTAELVMGLRWLHTQGYVHHDLKPANILVDSAGHCVISDFNSCKRLENGKLRRCTADDVVITQNYAAPELVDGRDAEYDQSVDIWSLGVVMSELLTGKLFGDEGSSTKRSLSQMCDDALSRMAAVEGACSYMVNLACRILVEDPSERMSLDSISRYPGFDIHMDIRWEDVLRKREPAIRTVVPLKPENVHSGSANAPLRRARSHEWLGFNAECRKQNMEFEIVDDVCV